MLELVKKLYRLEICLTIIIFILIYIYLKKFVYSKWKRHKIPHDNPTILIGNIPKEVFFKKITIGMAVQRSYNKFKDYPFYGTYMFFTPMIVIRDADLIKNILIKDFQYFTDRGFYLNNKSDPLSNGLFLLTGERWRSVRGKFTNAFTSHKLKAMFPLLTEITNEVINVCNENLENSDILEIKDFISRYTIDSICTLFFGVNSNSIRDKKSLFRYYGNLTIQNRTLINLLAFFAPEILSMLRIPFIDSEITSFFTAFFTDVIKKRLETKEKRNDFVNLMLKMMKNKEETEENTSTPFDIKEASVHAFVFFAAGFETSSSTATYFLQEIAENHHIQKKLHTEIDEFLKSSNDDITIESLMNLEYLDMVLKETMRKHPIITNLNRVCVKDYKISNSNYCVPKGTRILIPVYAIHRNPNIYPEPEKFDPTRFDKKNSLERHSCDFLSFGIGPRNCIGKRLGIIQSKLVLFTLLCNYRFSVCEKTKPITYSKKSFVHSPAAGVYLRIEKRNY